MCLERNQNDSSGTTTSLDGNKSAWSDNGNTSGMMASGGGVTFFIAERIAHVTMDKCRLRGQSG